MVHGNISAACLTFNCERDIVAALAAVVCFLPGRACARRAVCHAFRVGNDAGGNVNCLNGAARAATLLNHLPIAFIATHTSLDLMLVMKRKSVPYAIHSTQQEKK